MLPNIRGGRGTSIVNFLEEHASLANQHGGRLLRVLMKVGMSYPRLSRWITTPTESCVACCKHAEADFYVWVLVGKIDIQAWNEKNTDSGSNSHPPDGGFLIHKHILAHKSQKTECLNLPIICSSFRTFLLFHCHIFPQRPSGKLSKPTKYS